MAMKRTIDFHLNDQRKKADLYREMKKNDLNNSSNDEEPINISTNLYPLSHYVNDPEQLVHQLFSVVHGKRLARLIPPELKDMSIEELKADCLIQLLSMSKKRVLATLEGKEVNSSSNSDDSVENQSKQMLKAEKNNEITLKRSHKESKVKSSKNKNMKSSSESEQEKIEEKKAKSLLEILELEMKAKAIRALLGPSQKNNDNDIQIEEALKNEIADKETVEKEDEIMSWNERYEEREDVKEVVKTSRLCTNMRRRMLLYQQKMLADRAKTKADENGKGIISEDTIKLKLKETLQNECSKNNEEQSNIDTLNKESNNSNEELYEVSKTTENTDDELQTSNKVYEDIPAVTTIEKVTSSSKEHIILSNTQESTDDDSQKSTDLEKVFNEYTQKNNDLEITINEYSQINTDLGGKINTCSKKNDEMENTMNMYAQKNSDIESTINSYSIENNEIDETIVQDEKNDEDMNIGKCIIKDTDLINPLLNLNTRKSYVDLKAIVKEYSKRTSDIMALMGEYSQNNVDIQSVIGDYAKGNHKLETIIDEYSQRNAKIKIMVDEYSENNSKVEKIINQNNKKQSVIDKYIVSAVDADSTDEYVEKTLSDKTANEQDK